MHADEERIHRKETKSAKKKCGGDMSADFADSAARTGRD